MVKNTVTVTGTVYTYLKTPKEPQFHMKTADVVTFAVVKRLSVEEKEAVAAMKAAKTAQRGKPSVWEAETGRRPGLRNA